MFPDNLTWDDFEIYAKMDKPILIPVGSMEGHGYHLPLNTDTIIAYEISKKVAQKRNLIVFPPLSYSITSLNRPGNIFLSSSTFKTSIQGIVNSLAKFGLKKFVFILGHGGPEMKNAIEEAFTNIIMNNPLALSLSAIHIARIVGEVSNIDIIKNKHAGEWETSLIMALKPQVVKIGKLEETRYPKQAGVHGNPLKATKETGNKLAENITKRIINLIKNEKRKAGLFYNWRNSES